MNSGEMNVPSKCHRDLELVHENLDGELDSLLSLVLYNCE